MQGYLQDCKDGVICSRTMLSLNSSGAINQYGFISCLEGGYCNKGKFYNCTIGSECPSVGLVIPIPCPAGFYSPTQGNNTSCNSCPVGTYCPNQRTIVPSACPPGMVCNYNSQLSYNNLCPGGYYCIGSIITYFSRNDIARYTPQLCQSGTICIPGIKNNITNITDPASPQPCSEGRTCDAGTSSPSTSVQCFAGKFCNLTGMFNAEPGYYCPGTGNIMQIPCTPGTYSNTSGNEICKACPAGYFCSEERTINPVPCPAGTYRPLSLVNLICIPCPSGTWSNEVIIKIKYRLNYNL